MSASQLRRFWLVLVGVICLVAAFLAGGAAKSRCAFPFCRGYKSLLTGEAPQSRRAVAVSRTDTLDTSLYEVAVERVPLPFGGWYSSIEVLGEAVILASGEGDLYRLDDEGRFTQLPLRIPLQREAVAADVGEVVNTGWFSVKDLEAVEQPSGGWRLLASHHHWNPADSCFTLRVSEIALAGDLRPTAASSAWETVFETRPCLRIKETALPFAGAEAAAGSRRSRRAPSWYPSGTISTTGSTGRTSCGTQPARTAGSTQSISKPERPASSPRGTGIRRASR